MKLEFLYVPTADLEGTLRLYRDTFGFTELWREGDTTAALAAADGGVQVMLDAADPEAPSGPMFVVDDVGAFHAARPTALDVLDDPSEIPGGYLAVYREPGGGVMYVLDQSTESAGG